MAKFENTFQTFWDFCTRANVCLTSKGMQISQKTVARIMKEQGLQSRTVKKYKATTNSKHSYPIQDNVLNRKFKVEKELL
nr:IS3 family transposase [Bacillus thuringiensis]